MNTSESIRLTEAAKAHTQAAGNLMRQLSDLATAPVGLYEQRKLDALAEKKAKEEERKRQLARSSTRLDFIRSLPMAAKMREHTSEFRGKSIQEALLLDASVLWLPVPNARNVHEGEDVQWRVAKSLSKSSTFTWMPTYIIGQNILAEPAENSDDRLEELLLAPAWHGSMSSAGDIVVGAERPMPLVITSSMRSHDLLDELSVAGLQRPISEADYNGRVQTNPLNSQVYFASNVETSLRRTEPTEDRDDIILENMNEKRLRKIRDGLMRNGLRASVDWDNTHQLTDDVAEIFNFPIHAQKLATVFDAQSSYDNMVVKLQSE